MYNLSLALAVCDILSLIQYLTNDACCAWSGCGVRAGRAPRAPAGRILDSTCRASYFNFNATCAPAGRPVRFHRDRKVAKLLDKSVASRLASRLVAKVCTYDINNFIRNLYTLSRILTCLSTSLSEDHLIDGRIHHQISDSSTTVSVHRSMSASGWCIKDNFNALLCV